MPDDEMSKLRRSISEIAARLDDARGRPPTVQDMVDAREIQSRFDPIYRGMELGGAPGPMETERPGTYRRRLLKPMLPLHEGWRGTDIFNRRLDEQTVDNIEREVLSSAKAVVENPQQGSFTNPGKVRPVTTTDMGHRVTEYRGDNCIDWMAPFMAQAAVGYIVDPRKPRR